LKRAAYEAESAARSAAVAIAALASLLGCTRDIKLLPLAAKGLDAGDAAAAGDASGPAGEAGAAQCSGLGDPIMLPTAGGPACAGTLAARGHRFALCACGDGNVGSQLRTDAFDSTDSSAQDTPPAAAVGINGGLQISNQLRAGGAIYVAGSAGVSAADQLQSGASLRVGGPLSMLASQADVALDAFVAGNVTGDVRVTGTLHVPAGATVDPQVQAAATVQEPVSVAAPCDCSDTFVETASALTTAAANNGDLAAGIAPDRLAAATSAATLDLPCGTIYLSAIDAPAGLTLAVHGRALLAVAGDVDLGAGLNVALDAGAELDLLIGGRLTTAAASKGGAPTIGTIAAPARFRIWIAGTDSVVLDGGPTIGAVIHAPAAAVTAPAGLTLYGSLLAASFGFDDASQIHFDRAIFSSGVSCTGSVAVPVP
jgi:hypothetical protein